MLQRASQPLLWRPRCQEQSRRPEFRAIVSVSPQNGNEALPIGVASSGPDGRAIRFWGLSRLFGLRRGLIAILIPLEKRPGRESRMDSTATQTISLWGALASVPAHRRPAGKRYPLASLLLIALAAML